MNSYLIKVINFMLLIRITPGAKFAQNLQHISMKHTKNYFRLFHG